MAKIRIIGNTLTINNSNAKLHIVKGKLFLVTPGIFQLFFNSKGITNFTKKISKICNIVSKNLNYTRNTVNQTTIVLIFGAVRLLAQEEPLN